MNTLGSSDACRCHQAVPSVTSANVERCDTRSACCQVPIKVCFVTSSGARKQFVYSCTACETLYVVSETSIVVGPDPRD